MKPWEQSIVAAEGSCLEVIGCTDVIVGLGKLRRRHQIVVAPITQAGILGLDFLSMNGGVLDLPRRKLRFDSVEVPIISEGLTFTCCRITVAETVTIPAKQEVVIPGGYTIAILVHHKESLKLPQDFTRRIMGCWLVERLFVLTRVEYH